MPQLVLSSEEFNLVRQALASFTGEGAAEEVASLARRFDLISSTFKNTRLEVYEAKKLCKGSPFTIDHDAEVSFADNDVCWVNGWYLVERREQ